MIEGSGIRRVLMTADTAGGVWTYAMDLARGLGSHGVEVNLAIMGPSLSAHQSREAASIANLRLHESTYQLEWMPDPWADVERAGDWLLAIENEVSPDLVHLNGYAHGDLPWRSPHVVVGHSCVLSWWAAVKSEAAPAEWARYRSAVTRGVRAADFVVAPTRAMLNALQRFYGPLQWTAVVANGRDRARYHRAQKQPLILAAGRLWDEAKNIAVLAQAASGLDWPVFVAGDARNPGLTETSEFPKAVRPLGVMDAAELAGWYSRAAVYCLPARYEPFGLSVLEAALSGCALVLGDIPSLRENWDGAAVFVEPDDADALAWNLSDLTRDAARRHRLADRAWRRAQSFTIERMATAYLSLYVQLVQKSVPMAFAGD